MEQKSCPHCGQRMRDPSGLTIRELEVLKRLVTINTVPQIATLMKLSVKTVETHKFNLMRKLNVHSRVELLLYAFKNKIITAEELDKPKAIAS
jgi:two-component system response regulator NreC